ncbi:MAG: glycosyltransferase family 2 protein [Planctomycetota bacterium]
MNLLVVIVCYRAPELTIDCLRSLSTEVATVPGTKVAVCENGTGGESARKIEGAISTYGWEHWVWLKVIHPNRGFAGGNNVVLREAVAWSDPPKYFLLLNADTVVRPGALRLLVEAIEGRPEVGIVGPRLEGEDGKVQVSCFRFHSPLSEFVHAASTRPITYVLKRFEVPIWPSNRPIEPDWTSFACVLIRRQLVEQIGLLDDGFYLYFDDPDYCRRARRAGWGVLHCPEARVVHLVGQSNPVESLAAQRRRRPRYYYASRARYFAKSFGLAGLWLANLMWTAGRGIAFAREFVGNAPKRACEREWWDIWTNAHKPLSSSG